MDLSDHLVTTMDQLESLYGEVFPPAIAKEIDHVNAHYRAFIEAAPFFALATNGPDGLDCSPRGDPAGFVLLGLAHVDQLDLLLGVQLGHLLRRVVVGHGFGG